MSYGFVDSFRAGPGWNCVPSWSCSTAVWHVPLLSVQRINSWWWTVELSETGRVSCQNEFVKLVYLVGFIIKELQFIYILICHRTRCSRFLDLSTIWTIFPHRAENWVINWPSDAPINFIRAYTNHLIHACDKCNTNRFSCSFLFLNLIIWWYKTLVKTDFGSSPIPLAFWMI
jgi:hypothetical protein